MDEISRLLISKPMEISWYVTKMGDARINLRQADMVIEISPLRALECLAVFAEMIAEAHTHNLDKDVWDREKL